MIDTIYFLVNFSSNQIPNITAYSNIDKAREDLNKINKIIKDNNLKIIDSNTDKLIYLNNYNQQENYYILTSKVF